MTSNRRRITGKLELGPRGYSIVTEAGDHWVLEGCEPEVDLIGSKVTAEGDIHGLDRLRADWIGTASG
jgi:hypothetical protein